MVTVEHRFTADRNAGASSPPLAAKVQDAAGGLTFVAKAPTLDKAATIAAILSGFMLRERNRLQNDVCERIRSYIRWISNGPLGEGSRGQTVRLVLEAYKMTVI